MHKNSDISRWLVKTLKASAVIMLCLLPVLLLQIFRQSEQAEAESGFTAIGAASAAAPAPAAQPAAATPSATATASPPAAAAPAGQGELKYYLVDPRMMQGTPYAPAGLPNYSPNAYYDFSGVNPTTAAMYAGTTPPNYYNYGPPAPAGRPEPQPLPHPEMAFLNRAEADSRYIDKMPRLKWLGKTLWNAGGLYKGEALTTESWLNKPWNLGFTFGATSGFDLVDGWLRADPAFAFEIRLGRDLTPKWGLEGKFFFGNYALTDTPPAGSTVATYPGLAYAREAELFTMALSMTYYPWGETQWRPYFGIGFGLGSLMYSDINLREIHAWTATMPLTAGLKYRYNSSCALRFEICDNIVFSSGQDGAGPFGTWTFLIGLDWRFGGKARNYWPYNSSR